MNKHIPLFIGTMPLIGWLSLFLLTILMFYYGPFDWHVTNDLQLILYLVGVGASVTIGYLLATFISPRPAVSINLKAIAYSGAGLGLMISLPTMYIYTGKTPLDLGYAIANQGTTYVETIEHVRSGSGARLYFATLRSLLAPLTLVALPLFIILRRVIPFRWWVLAILFFLSQIALSLLRGTDKETIDLGLFIGMTLVSAGLLARQMGAISRRKMLALVCVSVIVVVAATQLFIFRKNTRLGETEQYCHALTHICADTDNVFVNWLPESDQISGSIIINYLSQGYYGLSLALQEPFDTTFGVGHSYFLMEKYIAATGSTFILERSYIGKIEQQGWDRKFLWATMYVWIANDIGFAGSLGFMFILGFMFSLSWRDFLGRRNIPAFLFFLHLVVIFFYSSMNNQVTAGADYYFSTVLWLCIWLFSRDARISKRRAFAPVAPEQA